MSAWRPQAATLFHTPKRGRCRWQSPRLRPSDRDPLLVDFALQGGGSHGAFTWGAFDRLLEETWLQIDGISGTSAGAMNAAVLADGHAAGGPEGARAALGELLAQRIRGGAAQPVAARPAGRAAWPLDAWIISPVFIAMDLLSRLFSPYDLEPGGLQPASRDFGRQRRLRAAGDERRSSCSSPPPMSTPAAATCSATREITPDVMLASACLPTMFQAVEIDGEPYWDGGYSGNPTFTPLVRECQARTPSWCRSIPVERPGTPRSARDILNRLNEVSFNSAICSRSCE